MPFAVVVTFRIAAGRMKEFLPLIVENARASLSDEPGCHQFDVSTDPTRPDEVFLYEVYTDSVAFEAHKQMPHYASFGEAAAGMIADKDVRTYGEVRQ